MKTSISDSSDYVKVCEMATKNEFFFKQFKRLKGYTDVLEHTSYEQGLQYLFEIKNQTPLLLENIVKFKENDIYGDPLTFEYEIGKISPSTIRYIKILSDLIVYFKDLNGFNIVEIGGGYGGQCKIILDYFDIKKYTIVDLPETIKLIKKYLDKFNYTNIELLTYDEIYMMNDIDLCISNYAFSECDVDIQQKYYDNIIKNSKNGYMLYNFISSVFGIKSFELTEIKRLIPNIQELEEKPLTHKDNKLLIWL